jgi:hypothetical protein
MDSDYVITNEDRSYFTGEVTEGYIREVLNKARKENGLPPVSTGDK